MNFAGTIWGSMGHTEKENYQWNICDIRLTRFCPRKENLKQKLDEHAFGTRSEHM